MANILIIAVIFIIVLIVAVGFVAQQLYTVQTIAATGSKTLIEKMTSSSISPLDTDRFKEIAIATPSENPPGPESFTEGSAAGSERELGGDTGEFSEKELLAETILSTGQPLKVQPVRKGPGAVPEGD